MRWFAIVLGIGVASSLASTVHAAEDAVKRGANVAIVGGCHDCHTAGYGESGGKVDPAASLKGTQLGWQGPWGTTYPANLRLTVKDMSEEKFLEYAKSFEARPPMPYYNVHAMSKPDLKALYAYIKSLGDIGEPAPDYVPPGEEPTTPYIVIAPPIMPKS